MTRSGQIRPDVVRLDQAIADLGHSRVQVLIVSDGRDEGDWPENPVDDLRPSDWPGYDVHDPVRRGSHSVHFSSPQAEARFPDHRNVAIRVEFLIAFR